MKRRTSITATLVALLLAPVSARAAFHAMPKPPVDPMTTVVVADTTDWAVPASPGASAVPLYVTHDAGSSWTPVTLPGSEPRLSGLGATVDGSFRAVVFDNNASAQVYRVGSDGSAAPIGAALLLPQQGSSGPGAVGQDGTVWIPALDSAQGALTMNALAPDGTWSTATFAGAGADTILTATNTLFGLRAGVEVSGHRQPGMYRMQGTQLMPAERWGVDLADGGLWLGSDGVSWDAGVHWADVPNAFTRPRVIPRSPGEGPPRYVLNEFGRVATRLSPSLFRGTGLVVPGDARIIARSGLAQRFDDVPARVVETGDRLVAWDTSTIYIHDGPLEPAPTQIGDITSDTAAMVDRANVLRADAGLPPLIADAQISVASRNHSRYLAMHPDDPDPHSEDPGQTGFSGQYPADRCNAVGASCISEAIGPGPDWWIGSVYHRPSVGSPLAGTVGGSDDGTGPPVLNTGEDFGVAVDVVGFPNGVWRGPAKFYGGEHPDPAPACQSKGTPITFPTGTPITLYTPNLGGFHPVISITMHADGESDPLAGCLLGNVGTFIPFRPLIRGTTYDLVAQWDAGGGNTPTTSWSFLFDPPADQQPSDPPGVKLPSSSAHIHVCRASGLRRRLIRRSGSTIVLRLVDCTAGSSVQVTLRRVTRMVKRRVVNGPARAIRLRLQPGWKNGIYSLTVRTFTRGGPSQAKRVVLKIIPRHGGQRQPRRSIRNRGH